VAEIDVEVLLPNVFVRKLLKLVGTVEAGKIAGRLLSL
jgi:hypothetical protein